jgi:hypothetical protein
MRTHPLANALLVTALVLAGLAFAPGAEAKKAEPGYLEVHVVSGILPCAVGAVVIATDNLCPAPLFLDRSEFTFDVPDGARVALAELQWTPSTVFSHDLALTAPVVFERPDEQRPEGPSVLRAQIGSITPGGSSATQVELRVGASHDPGVVVSQTFRLALSVFVNTDMPAGYSAFP